MSVSEGLDKLRASIPECQFVAFVDLDASMVLSVSAQTKKRQEMLDALAENASRLLPMEDEALAQCLSPGESAAVSDFAVQLTELGTVAFVRSLNQGREALCCGCSPNVEIGAVIADARAALANLDETE